MMQPDYKHAYDEDSFDDEGNSLGKQLVFCVDGELATDFDRGPGGEVEPIWFLDFSTEEPAACRVCSGEVKPDYVSPESATVKMSYRVGKTILDRMAEGIGTWEHDNENRCQEDPDVSKNCSLCLAQDWLDSTLRPALADRPIKMSKGRAQKRTKRGLNRR